MATAKLDMQWDITCFVRVIVLWLAATVILHHLFAIRVHAIQTESDTTIDWAQSSCAIDATYLAMRHAKANKSYDEVVAKLGVKPTHSLQEIITTVESSGLVCDAHWLEYSQRHLLSDAIHSRNGVIVVLPTQLFRVPDETARSSDWHYAYVAAVNRDSFEVHSLLTTRAVTIRWHDLFDHTSPVPLLFIRQPAWKSLPSSSFLMVGLSTILAGMMAWAFYQRRRIPYAKPMAEGPGWYQRVGIFSGRLLRWSTFLVLPLLGLAIAVVIFGRNSTEPIELDTYKIDLGSHRSGARVHSKVTLSNRSSEPIFINSVRSSCGCIIPQEFDKRVPAGGAVDVPFETVMTASGKGQQVLEVMTTPRAKLPLRLEISYSVIGSVYIEPRSMDIGLFNGSLDWKEIGQVKLYGLLPDEMEGLSIEAVDDIEPAKLRISRMDTEASYVVVTLEAAIEDSASVGAKVKSFRFKLEDGRTILFSFYWARFSD